MSEKILFIKKLLDYVDEFYQDNDHHSVSDFSEFLSNSMHQKKKASFNQDSEEIPDISNYKQFPDIVFAKLILSISRFEKHLLKEVFQRTSFKTLDEFALMASLLTEKSMLKNRLIHKHMLEVSTGSELLKRLKNKGLIKEVQDTKDRRAKRVSLTENGRKELISIFGDMYLASKKISGNLSDEEIESVNSALAKLNSFHKTWFNCKNKKEEGK